MEPHDRTFLGLPGRWLLSPDYHLLIPKASPHFVLARVAMLFTTTISLSANMTCGGFPFILVLQYLRNMVWICHLCNCHISSQARSHPPASSSLSHDSYELGSRKADTGFFWASSRVTLKCVKEQHITFRGRSYPPSFTSMSPSTPMILYRNCDRQDREYIILSTQRAWLGLLPWLLAITVCWWEKLF